MKPLLRSLVVSTQNMPSASGRRHGQGRFAMSMIARCRRLKMIAFDKATCRARFYICFTRAVESISPRATWLDEVHISAISRPYRQQHENITAPRVPISRKTVPFKFQVLPITMLMNITRAAKSLKPPPATGATYCRFPVVAIHHDISGRDIRYKISRNYFAPHGAGYCRA